MKAGLHDIDLKLLQVFRTIARCGGFTSAQAELNTSQSTISTQMTQLETRLGMRLCQRGHAGYRLTDDGKAVLNACEQLFASIEDFDNRIAETRKYLAGELRIGILNNTITHPGFKFAEAVSNFHQEAPQVQLNIEIGIDTGLEWQVLDGRLHFAFVMRHTVISALEYRPLVEEDHYLFCGRGHSFFEKADSEITDDELSRANYVDRAYLESIRELNPPFPSHLAAVSPEVEACAQLVLSGCYIAYLPSHYAKLWIDAGLMRSIRKDELRRRATIYVVTRKAFDLPKIALVFLKHLDATHELPLHAPPSVESESMFKSKMVNS